MAKIRLLLVAFCMIVLAACAGNPVAFYTLQSTQDLESATPKATADYYISVLPVTVPADVDQPQLLVRKDTSSVQVLETHRWAAPLSDEIQSITQQQLTRDLGARDVYGESLKTDKPVYQIALKISRFESSPGAYAFMAGSWSVRAKGDSETFAKCAAQARQNLHEDSYAALISGHQQALHTLIDHIAQSVANLNEGKQPYCP